MQGCSLTSTWIIRDKVPGVVSEQLESNISINAGVGKEKTTKQARKMWFSQLFSYTYIYIYIDTYIICMYIICIHIMFFFVFATFWNFAREGFLKIPSK